MLKFLLRRWSRLHWYRAWQQFAAARGGTYRVRELTDLAGGEDPGHEHKHGQRPPRSTDLPIIEIPVGPIVVSVHVLRGATTGYWTTFEATFELGLGARFVLSTLRSDIETRGEIGLVFDAPADEVARALRASVGTFQLDSNGEAVALTVDGFCHDERALAFGVDQVAAIGRSDGLGLNPLRQLAGTWIDRDPQTELPAVELALPELVRLGPVRGESIRTEATTAVGAGGEKFGPDVGDAVIRCRDGVATLAWPGIERNRERLLDGARALVGFARSAGGAVYR